jgi:hypothetical protein
MHAASSSAPQRMLTVDNAASEVVAEITAGVQEKLNPFAARLLPPAV